MAKIKKKSKTKPVKTQEEKPQIKLISLEEHSKRQRRHDFRIEAVRKNDEAFRDVTEKYEDLTQLEGERLKWEKYVTCDKLPDAKSPSAIRTYLYKWLFEEWDIIKSYYNWVLDIDERSILTQDMTVADVTRIKLQEKVLHRGEFSSYYVANAITIINGIEELLDVGVRNQLKLREELVMAKNEVRNRIRSSIDNLSYLILNNTDGNMEMIDATSEKYTIQTNPFNISFWGVKSVPCDFTKRETPEVVINLEAIDGVVTVPMSSVFEDMLMRGLHLNFDHRSSYAKNVNLKEARPDVRDFKMALVKEWNLRKQIESAKLQQMREQRENYENELRIQQEEAKKEEETRNKKGSKDAKPKKRKKPKVLVAPPTVDANTYLDVEDEFIEKDDIEHLENMKKLQPEFLNLEPHEINLREYIILGGVYEINFLEKPVQRLVGSCYLHQKELPERLRYTRFECSVEYAEPKRMSETSFSKDFHLANSPEMMQAATEDHSPELPKETRDEVQYNTLLQISLKLPSHLCRWAIPKTCRWSTKIDGFEDDRAESASPAQEDHLMPVVTKDMYLGTMEARKSLHYVIKNQILPRMDSLHKFPDELAEEKEWLTVMTRERERLQKEAELDAEMAESTDNRSIGENGTNTYKEKMMANSTPPAFLFPRPNMVGRLKISSNELLGDEFPDEIKNLSDADRIRLSEYIAELDKLAKARHPQLEGFWTSMRQINRNKSPKGLKSLDIDERPTSSSRKTKSFEKHSRRSLKKGKAKGVGSRSSVLRSSSNTSEVSMKTITSFNREPTTTSLPETKGSKIQTDEEEAYSTRKGCWSTEYVFKEQFNEEDSKMTYWTDRLGIFGFAFKRYLHFPFKNWAIYPDGEKSEAVVLEIVSPFASFFLRVGAAGYTVSVITGMQKHAELIEPIGNLRVFKQQLEKLGLNIFTKEDTSVYLSDISVKHLPLEYHVYQTISQFCLTHKFSRSKWNWLAHRRVLLMKFGSPQQPSHAMDTIQMTSEESQFCTVNETCTSLDKVVLDYIPTTKHIKCEPDLHRLLMSRSSARRVRNAKVEYLVNSLLKAVQPLTYCK